jgi:hypothetical protein
MTPNPQKTDWSVIENVFELLQRDGRILTEGEKQVIAGQRRINGILYEAIDALLKTFPDDSAQPAITQAKVLLTDFPGQEPPGCQTSAARAGS